MAYKENGPKVAEVSQISFYASKLQGNFDKTTTPDLNWISAGNNATDSIGDTITNGTEVPDVIDTHRATRFAIDLSGASTDTPSIYLQTSEPLTADFAILDNNTVRSEYDASIENSLDILYGAATVGASTPVVSTRVQSKKLASGSPYYSFDGVNDNIDITGSELDEFSIVARVRFRDFANGWICGNKTQDNYMFGTTSATTILFNDDTGDKIITVDEMQLSTWIHFVLTGNSAFKDNLYVDGVNVEADRTTGANHLVRFMNALGESDSRHLNGDIAEFSYYNRVLAPKEIEQMALGYPVPKPLIIGDNSNMNSIGDWTNSNFTTLDANDTVAGKMYALMPTGTQGRGFIGPNNDIGKEYIISVKVRLNSGTALPLRIGSDIISGVEGTDFFLVTPTSTETEYSGTVTFDDGFLRFGVMTGANGSAYEFDDWYLTDPDTLVTFPLEVDKWGNDTELVPNGSAWTGATGETPPTGWSDNSGAITMNYSVSSDILTAVNTDGGGASIVLIKDTLATVVGEVYAIVVNGLSGDGAPIVKVGSSANGDEYLTTVSDVHKTFTATGTTTHLTLVVGKSTNNSIILDDLSITRAGAVAAWQPNGVRSTSWADLSTNDLGGTVSGASARNLPSLISGDGDFTLVSFDTITDQDWHWEMNPDGLSAAIELLKASQIGLGSVFTTPVNPDANFIKESGYGIDSGTTTGGRVFTNRRFGKKRIFQFNWSYVSADDLLDFEQFFDTIEPSEGYSNYPFWFSINSDKPDEQFYYGRTVGHPIVTSLTWGAYSVSIQIETMV